LKRIKNLSCLQNKFLSNLARKKMSSDFPTHAESLKLQTDIRGKKTMNILTQTTDDGWWVLPIQFVLREPDQVVHTD